MNDRPRTLEALRALPIGPAFGTEIRDVNGVPTRFFVMDRQPVAIFHGDDDPISWADEDGAWKIGCYSDGSWFKARA